jgi:murein DD-endopeptidase MepM/ murein hydrolase activator NlpD
MPDPSRRCSAGKSLMPRLDRRSLILTGAAALVAGAARADTADVALAGKLQQSGFAFGRTSPRADLTVDGVPVGQASKNGLFVIGFDRDSPPAARLDVGGAQQTLAIAPTQYDIQRIDGLPDDQVSPTDPALLARIKAEAERKAAGFASNIDADAFRDGFVMPVQGARLSARFGGQRILNGVPNRPHYGSDLAAPIGTPVRAPAGGFVSFAESNLHFDGALVMIDHGQGLISCYLHLSRVDAVKGQWIKRGDMIGAVGMEGRATGPHLCWRMKWRGRNLDPLLMVGARAPV